MTDPHNRENSAPPIRTRIDNAHAILKAFAAAQPGSVKRHVEIALETIGAARQAIDDRDALLEAATDIELEPLRELQQARRELADAAGRETQLRLRIAELEARIQAEDALHDDERKKLRDLEQKTSRIEETLASDPAAFDAFMQNALDGEDRRRKRGGKR